MVSELKNFKKKREFLVCIDSDGCAMDTMDIKHIKCFGPCMIEEWSLEEWKDEILTRWNEINLYSMTRGINRFKGLALALSEISQKYKKIDDLDSLINWTKQEQELSMQGLRKSISEENSDCLKKVLSWSEAVNQAIRNIKDEEIKPFAGVVEGITFIASQADVAVVSSANAEAVIEEWGKYGLLAKTDILLTQEAGTKAYCIAEMKKKGYESSKILMIGDAPGDKEAAEENEVSFYPILVKRETKSWQELQEVAFPKFIKKNYIGAYQNELNEKFRNNLC
ncbi:phosphatase [Anaerocolumna cellulosilytica]|uniref:Phosphatase n=1 Tax=Anaerocolumna cellulosilytica TaxID=433286 RepID=A0A6S6R594_9FIRM|nr:HAD hydrolase-like protein [Anaerocolumna cellulosilytica]MBB5194808.1 phosphoglycolate phosphatase-like HAD superfamily hydrolase [Anaerocolumna cellulosilytica]BCJ94228.1 phosphatase [Anaerocolumna cellulosilytica]